MQPDPLRFRDIFLFQFGNAGAIRRVVASRWSLVIGVLLVFTAAIARNYDRTFLPWHGEKFAGPFIAALVSSILVFLAIWLSGTRDREDKNQPGFFRQYPGFLAAFLMTAPLAWFYAIPVESMTDNLLAAAKWNVFFLSLVSLWRVWLILHVAKVITGAPIARLLFPVLIPVTAEAYVGTIFAGFNLAGAMGGILPPDKAFTLEAIEIIFTGSAIIFWVSVAGCIAIAIARWRVGKGWRSNFAGTWMTPPRKTLLMSGGTAILWLLIAIPWQLKIWNRIELGELVSNKNYDAAAAFLRSRERHDFPPGPAFYEDNRFAYSANVTEMLKRIGAEDPAWIHAEYNEVAGTAIVDEFSGYRSPDYEENIRNLISAVSETPGGRETLQAVAGRVLTDRDSRGPELSTEKRKAFIHDLEEAGVEIPDEWRPITPPPPPTAGAGDKETSPVK